MMISNVLLFFTLVESHLGCKLFGLLLHISAQGGLSAVGPSQSYTLLKAFDEFTILHSIWLYKGCRVQ